MDEKRRVDESAHQTDSKALHNWLKYCKITSKFVIIFCTHYSLRIANVRFKLIH